MTKTLRVEDALRVTALLAAIAVVAMIVIFAIAKIGQEPLQAIHSVDDYRVLLLRNPPVLRAVFALDNAFIVFYSTVFVLLAILCLREGANRIVVTVALVALLLTSLLDMMENFHLMSLLSATVNGLSFPDSDIRFQFSETLLKFHVSYLGFFVLGFALPRDSRTGRMLAWLFWSVQLPIGIAIYAAPRELVFGLVVLRFSFFVVGLLLAAKLAHERIQQGKCIPLHAVKAT